MAARLFFVALCMSVTAAPKQDAHFQLDALSGIEINVSVGSTALLTCTFNGCRDSGAAYQVLWQKKGKGTERLVVRFQKGNVEFNNLAKNYANRTSMDWNWMQLGNATLQLRNVSMKDSGEYTCWVRGLPQGSRSVHERCQVVLCVQSSRSDQRQLIVCWSLYLLSLAFVVLCLHGCRSWLSRYQVDPLT